MSFSLEPWSSASSLLSIMSSSWPSWIPPTPNSVFYGRRGAMWWPEFPMRAEHLIVVGEKQTPVLQVRQEAWSFTSWPKKHMYFLFFQNVLSIWQNLQSILCKPHIWLPAWLGHEKRERKWSRPLEYMNSSTVRILRHKIETTRSRRAGCQTSWRPGW